MSDYIKRDDAIHAITQAELENRLCFVASAVKQTVRNLPAAEVVPRIELDALISDLRIFTKRWYEQDIGFPCMICKYNNCGGCTNENKAKSEEVCAGKFFDWRGIPSDDMRMDGGK